MYRVSYIMFLCIGFAYSTDGLDTGSIVVTGTKPTVYFCDVAGVFHFARRSGVKRNTCFVLPHYAGQNETSV